MVYREHTNLNKTCKGLSSIFAKQTSPEKGITVSNFFTLNLWAVFIPPKHHYHCHPLLLPLLFIYIYIYKKDTLREKGKKDI